MPTLQAVQTSSISFQGLITYTLYIYYYIDGTVIILVKCTPSLTIRIVFTIGIVALHYGDSKIFAIAQHYQQFCKYVMITIV